MGYSDKVFEVVGGDEACYKILRTWYFADWCEVDKPLTENWWVDPSYSGDVFNYVQKIIVHDSVPPVCMIDPIPGDTISTVNCDGNFVTTVSIEDECGLIEYYWEIQDGSGTVVASGSGDVDMDLANSFEVSASSLEIGPYRLVVVTRDNCQNESVCDYAFSIVGGKKPSLTCITMISIELTPMDFDLDNEADTAMGVIWAEEYIASAEPPCNSDESNLVYRIELAEDGDGMTVPSADSLPIGCGSIPPGNVTEVWVWVLDTVSGTADYCSAFLEIQTNMGGCGDISRSAILQGSVTTEMGETVEHAEVIATLGNGSILNYLTRANGQYAFGELDGQNVSIQLEKNTDVTNGVSTADLILIQKHILKHTELPNQYRLEAADANRDGQVSPRDLVDIRKLILGFTDELPNSNSWIFLNNMNNQFSYELEDMSANAQIDWTGIKIGDVNLDNNPKRSRSGEALVFRVEDHQIHAGETKLIDINIDEFRSLEGYQFTMEFGSEVEVLAVLPTSTELNLTSDQFNLNQLESGKFSTNWFSSEGTTIQSGAEFIQVEVRAKKDVQLSDIMTINSGITSAEAYNMDNELLNVAVRFVGVDQPKAELYQNSPNPFAEETLIQFYLPQNGEATLHIYDVTGRTIKAIEGEYQQGINQVVIESGELPASGIYYYQLHTDQTTEMKKMILVE